MLSGRLALKAWWGLAFVLLACTPAFAQDARAAKAQTPQPIALPSQPPLSPFGKVLARDGIVLRASAFDDFASVASGGQRLGSTNVVSETFGADFDLARLVGVHGGRLHVTFNQENGPSISNLVNTGIVLQSRFKPYSNLRFAIMTYEQQLAGNRVNVELGRTTPLMYFNSSPIYCQFQSNALCATPLTAPLYDGTLSPYPYSTWGGRVRLRTGTHTAVQVGAFEVNPSLIPTNGFDWSTANATGTLFPVEFSYGTELSERAYPQHIRIGLFHDTSMAREPYVPPGTMRRQLYGRTGFYAMADHVVWRPDKRRNANLTVFGGYTQLTDEFSKYRLQSNLGLLATGLLRGRPADTMGLSLTQFELGSSETALLEATRLKVGDTAPVHPNETLLELNYGLQLTRGVRLLPALQYIINPDTTPNPAVLHPPNHALVVGARLTFDIHDALGLPTHLSGSP